LLVALATVARVTLYLDGVKIGRLGRAPLRIPWSEVRGWARRGPFEWVLLTSDDVVSLGSGPAAAEAIRSLESSWVGERPPWLSGAPETYRERAIEPGEARRLLRSRGLAPAEFSRAAAVVAEPNEVEATLRDCSPEFVRTWRPGA
jgi:hypothetical protein